MSLNEGFKPMPRRGQSSSGGSDCYNSSPCTNPLTTSSSGSHCSSSAQDHRHEGTCEECKSVELQSEGLVWAARHCLFSVLANYLHTAELLGSLMSHREFWDLTAAAAKPAASATAAIAVAAATAADTHKDPSQGAQGKKVGLGSPGQGWASVSSSSAAEPGQLTPAVGQLLAELVSKQPMHNGLIHRASIGALAAKISDIHSELTDHGGCKYLVPCGAEWPEETVQHVVGSLASAVQEQGVVQVLQALVVARQLPGWSAPCFSDRQVAFWFCDHIMKLAVGGDNRGTNDKMQLRGSDSAMTMMMAVPKTLQSVIHVVTNPPVLDGGAPTLDFEDLEAIWQERSSFLDTCLVSFCCCNSECTSLEGVSELGLVLRSERSSSISSSSRKGPRAVGAGVCSGCSVSCYCSRACQRQHWAAGHKGVCAVFAGVCLP
jgi:hypothetical protein